MVGKLSDDRKMSGSRIPVMYMWKYGAGHPYSTPNDELRKSIAAKHGELEDVYERAEPALCGDLLEPILVANAATELGLPDPVLSPPVFTYVDESFQCSVDGLCYAPGPISIRADGPVEIFGGDQEITVSGSIPIECKVTGDYRKKEIPDYRGPIQLQAQMMVTGADFGVLMTLYRGTDRQIVVYRRDEAICQRIRDICHDFLARVESEEFYPPVTIDDAAATFPNGDGEIELPSMAEKVEHLDKLREQKKLIEDEIDATQAQIMAEMGDHDVAICGRYRVRWPVQHYKAQPEKVVAAKPARDLRLKTLKIAEIFETM